MEHTVGIDLGTTHSAVARVIGDDATVLKLANGDRTMPSVVSFEDDGSVLAGHEAQNVAVQRPNKTIESVKRHMGEETPVATIAGQEYRPEEISALILKRLLSAAERNLGGEITSAVITVPAYFSNREREATKRAGRITGLEVERILNEPTAAMLAHGVRADTDMTALVYDLGGGTFDVSVVSAGAGVFEVIGTDGLSEHGGDGWDAQLFENVLRIVTEDTGRTIDDPAAQQRIWDAVRSAKHTLSRRERAQIEIPFLLSDPQYTFDETISRDQFQSLTADLLDETIAVCYELLDEIDYRPAEIDEVLLVGGSTRMPQVQARLTDEFGDIVRRSGSPDEIVAKGAAIQAAALADQLPVVGDTGDERLQAQEQDMAADGPGLETYSPPDEYDTVTLIDVTSRSLGIETVGDEFSTVIPRNTTVPTERTEQYHTTHDNQTIVKVKVLQGESSVASENELLDTFTLTGLPRAPAGEVSVDVTLSIDQNGILNVDAESTMGSQRESIAIEQGVEFSGEEIEQMRRDLPAVSEPTE